MKGQKHDDGKQRWHALPLVILKPLADVMEAGAKKYQRFNCLEPFDNWNERFYDGQIRHTEASQIDPLAINEEDGGVYHLAQVAFNALLRLHNALREEQENERTSQEHVVNTGVTGSPAAGTSVKRTLETSPDIVRSGDKEKGEGYRKVEADKICNRGGDKR